MGYTSWHYRFSYKVNNVQGFINNFKKNTPRWALVSITNLLMLVLIVRVPLYSAALVMETRGAFDTNSITGYSVMAIMARRPLLSSFSAITLRCSGVALA